MRLLILGLTASMAFAATAAERLPIAGTYGSPSACAMFLSGGEYAVFHDGMREDGTPASFGPDDDSSPIVLLTPTALIGVETECAVSAIAGNDIGFACEDDAGEGVVSATIIEDRAARTVAFTNTDGTQILRACD